MKKTVSLIMTIMMVFLCIGCGKDTGGSNAASGQNTEQNNSVVQNQEQKQAAEQTAETTAADQPGSFETIFCCDSPSKDKLAVIQIKNNNGNCDLNAMLCITYPDIAANLTVNYLTGDGDYPLESDVIKTPVSGYARSYDMIFADPENHESERFLSSYYDYDYRDNFTDRYQLIDAENENCGWGIANTDTSGANPDYEVCYRIPDTEYEKGVHVFSVRVSSELIDGVSQKSDDLESCRAALEWCKEHVSYVIDQVNYPTDYDRVSAATLYTDAEGNPLASDYTVTMDAYTAFLENKLNINLPLSAGAGCSQTDDNICAKVIDILNADPEQYNVNSFLSIKDGADYVDSRYSEAKGDVAISGELWNLYKYPDKDSYCATKNFSMSYGMQTAVIYFRLYSKGFFSDPANGVLSKKDAANAISMLYSD